MNPQLRHVLISFVLMAAIIAVMIALSGPRTSDGIGILLLVGSLLAALDFLRALWRYVRAELAPEDDEEEGEAGE